MFCGKCGNKLDDDAKFCTKCGNVVSAMNSENINLNDVGTGNEVHSDSANSDSGVNRHISGEADSGAVSQNADYGDGFNRDNSKSKFKAENVGIGKRLLSVFLCIIMFLSVFCSVSAIIIRSFLNEENVRNICSSIEIDRVMVYTDGEKKTVPNLILDVVSNELLEKYHIDEAIVRKTIKNDKVKNLITHIAVDYVNYIAFGVEPKYLVVNEVVDMVRESADVIRSTTSYEMSELNYEQIQTELENGELKFLTKDGLKDALGFDFGFISILLSIPMIVAYIGLSLLMLILLIILNFRTPKFLIKTVGVAIMIAGIFGLLLSVGAFIVNAIIDMYILDLFVKPIALQFLIWGIAVTVVGVILLLIGSLIKIRRKSNIHM